MRQNLLNALFTAPFKLFPPTNAPKHRIRCILWSHFGESSIRGAKFSASTQAIATGGVTFTAFTCARNTKLVALPRTEIKNANWVTACRVQIAGYMCIKSYLKNVTAYLFSIHTLASLKAFTALQVIISIIFIQQKV